MKVRLYKGPRHNKIYVIEDHLRSIVVDRPVTQAWKMGDQATPFTSMSHYERGLYEWSPHTHPDGCRYFIWTGWN